MASLRDLQDIHEKFGAVTGLYSELQLKYEALEKRIKNLEMKNVRDAKAEKNKDA